MYEYITGQVVNINRDSIVLDSHGIGYVFLVSSVTIAQAVLNETMKMYTRMIVREDEIYLCGFHNMDEVKLFDFLRTVSKIGPKVALGMLSFASPEDIVKYIQTDDVAALTKLPGIGRKTAERIVLELKDKIKKEFGEAKAKLHDRVDNIVQRGMRSTFDEAVTALISLGYTNEESKSACERVYDDDYNTEMLIKKALGWLMTN